MHPTAQQLVDHLGMTQLPVEATFFVSTYRSAADTATGGPVGTAMIGMYSDDPPSRSLFHRLDFDEVWHFYAGDPIRLVLLRADGTSDEVIMGSNLLAGQLVQFVIPAGV
ncbi:MAG: cupin domain-containing protein, partial [Ilumatobacteraceae bacterium]